MVLIATASSQHRLIGISIDYKKLLETKGK